MKIELITLAGLKVTLDIAPDSQAPALAKEEMAYVVAKNLFMFPELQRAKAKENVKKLVTRTA